MTRSGRAVQRCGCYLWTGAGDMYDSRMGSKRRGTMRCIVSGASTKRRRIGRTRKYMSVSSGSSDTRIRESGGGGGGEGGGGDYRCNTDTAGGGVWLHTVFLSC